MVFPIQILVAYKHVTFGPSMTVMADESVAMNNELFPTWTVKYLINAEAYMGPKQYNPNEALPMTCA